MTGDAGNDPMRSAVAATLEGMCEGPLSVNAQRATVNLYDGEPARLRFWQQVIDELLDNRDVLREGRAAVVTAGPPGAGKSTHLQEAYGGALAGWRLLDADVVKLHLIRQAVTDKIYEPLLRRKLVDGRPVMPLELAGLVHRESVQIVADMRQICMSRGENVVLEGTLSWEPQIDVHLREMAQYDYDSLDVVLVDVERDVAHKQALARWWDARIDVNSPLGGRFVPKAAIDACFDERGRSICRANAEELRRRAQRQGLAGRLLTPSRELGQPLRAVGELGS